MSAPNEWSSSGSRTGTFPTFHSNDQFPSTHLVPRGRMFGQPFMIKACAVVDVRRRTFNILDAATSSLAVLSRMGELIYSTTFFSCFAREPSPTTSMQEPLSTHRRDPVATSPDKDVSDAWATIGVTSHIRGTFRASSFPFRMARR